MFEVKPASVQFDNGAFEVWPDCPCRNAARTTDWMGNWCDLCTAYELFINFLECFEYDWAPAWVV